MKVFKKLFSDEDEYETKEYDEVDEVSEQKEKPVNAPRAQATSGSTIIGVIATGSGNKEIGISMREVIENVRKNETVFVTLTSLKDEDKVAAINILQGATHALDATLEPLNENQLFVAPKGWLINGEFYSHK